MENLSSREYQPIKGITPTPHQTGVLNNVEDFFKLREYDVSNLALLGYNVDTMSEQSVKSTIETLNANDEVLFGILQGRAGVGKTTVAQWIVDMADEITGRVCVAYPTHRAGNVLRGKISGSCEYSTIQALVGMSPNMNIEKFNPNKLKFDFRKKDELPMDAYRTIILDEASMVGDKLFDFFVSRCKQFGIKVLFIGHKAQLPGVGDVLSKVFTDVKNVFYLNEIIRQKETNPNGPLLTQLEEDILLEMAVYQSIKPHPADNSVLFDRKNFLKICENEGLNPDLVAFTNNPNDFVQTNWRRMLVSKHTSINDETGEGYQCLDRKGYEDVVSKLFVTEDYNADRSYLQLYNFTNKVVRKINRLVKKFRSDDNDSADVLSVGETIMAYANVKGNDAEMLLANSEDFVIDRIEEVETHWMKQPVAKNSKQSKFDLGSSPVQTKTVLVAAADGMTPDVILKAYACYVKPVQKIDDDPRNFEEDFFYIAHPDSYEAIVKEYYTYYNDNGFGFRNDGGATKEDMRRAYGHWLAFKDKNCLLNDLYFAPNLKTVADNKVNENFRFVLAKNIDRGYACTIHKSQGGTRVNVGVDLSDLEQNEAWRLKKIPMTMEFKRVKEHLEHTTFYKKLLYVAWSRTSKFTFLCVKE